MFQSQSFARNAIVTSAPLIPNFLAEGQDHRGAHVKCGAGLKDCSGFNIFLNSYGLFHDEGILKKHGKKCPPAACQLKLLKRFNIHYFFRVTAT